MDPRVTVRPLTKTNFVQAIQLAPGEPHLYGTRPISESLSRCILYRNPLPLLVYLDETVVGFALLASYRDGVKLKSFLIDPAWRGRGIANSALKRIISLAHTNVYLSVHPDNKAALHIYEKNGFRIYPHIKTQQPPYWIYMCHDYKS